MTIRRLLLPIAAALALSTLPGYAGPCSSAIDRMQARIDAWLEAAAGAGPEAPVSSGAKRHRQPTPRSIAAAESRLGDLSPQTVDAVRVAMAQARNADQAGEKRACKQALAVVRRAIGR